MGYGLAGELWIQGEGIYMPNSQAGSPTFGVSDVVSASRLQPVNGTTGAFGFPTGFFGARTGFDLVVKDRWVVPIIDFGFYGIMGSYSDVLTSADGSLFRLHPAGAMLFDVELLGIGARFKLRRWMIEAAIKPGFAVYVMPAAVSSGVGWTDISALNSVTPTLRASLSLCRRLDPKERVCASVTPNIYAWGWGNGGSVSLRWEFGS